MIQTLESVEMKDLPAKVKLVLPAKSSGNFSMVFSIIGFSTFFVGAMFIIFGPDQIYYNMYDGMTFIQYLQAYPGPIASVGVLILSLTQAASNSAKKGYMEEVNRCIDRAIQIEEDEIPEGFTLSMEVCEDEEQTFLVKLIEKPDEVELTPEEETA